MEILLTNNPDELNLKYLVGTLLGMLEGLYVGLTVGEFDGDLLVKRVGDGTV
jgi:hypothetical protein